MPTYEHARALGEEIERLRLARDIRSIRQLAKDAGVSNQHLGQIIKGYRHPMRGYTVPSDEVLEKIAAVLDVPVSRFHSLLGRFPETPFPALTHPEAAELAETYNGLSQWGRKIVLDAVRSAAEAERLLPPDTKAANATSKLL